MSEHDKNRPTVRSGGVSWNEGERETLIAEAIARGLVTRIPAGESGPEQTRSTWRARKAPQKDAPPQS